MKADSVSLSLRGNLATMSRKLRIAVATNFFPNSSQPHRGRPMYNQTKALSKLADVKVFCIEPRYPGWKALQPRSFAYRSSEAGHSVPGVEVEYLYYPAFPIISRPFNGYWCGYVLRRALEKFRPDLVIGYYLYPEGFGAVSAAKALGIPVLVGALGSDIRRITDEMSRLLVQKTALGATFAIAVSDELRERLVGLGVPPQKCKAIHNGCDASVFRPMDRDKARAELNIQARSELVVFTGRFVAVKGVEILLDALALMIPSRPSLHLCCIGEGPLEQKLRFRASRPDLRGHVIFVGSARPDEISLWLAASNVLCLPSYSEGCPNVVIEALGCGRPVVASDVGGLPELVDDRCGILVRPEDPAALSEGLSKALDHPWDQLEIARCYRRTWDDMAAETYELACSVVNGKLSAS